MKLISAMLALAGLAWLLAACGGGGNSGAEDNAPPVHKSRLIAFEAGELAKGLSVPEFTSYWTLSEQRNGNVFPVKAGANDDGVLTVRIDPAGKFGTLGSSEFQEATLISISSTLSTLATKHWNDDLKATAAGVLLLADSRAPYTALLQLCHEMVDLQVRNLWLVTLDARDGEYRLLPLKIDTAQVFNEWYQLQPKDAEPTLHFKQTAGRTQLGWFDGKGETFDAAAEWQTKLPPQLPKFAKRSTRVQFELAPSASIADFAIAADLCAPLGYVDVEPYWPALDAVPDSGTVEKRRELAEYGDKLEATKDLKVPTLSDYWRASAADRGLPPASSIDSAAPLLGIRATADGSFATRTRDEPDWTHHTDDLGVQQALQRNAGEIDFDTGLSELQVLLAMDRDARWETFLGLLEMMRLLGCHRLFVVTYDVLGPTLRLLDLSLPMGDVPADTPVASVVVERHSTVAEGSYEVTFLLDGQENKLTGPRFSSSLASLTTKRKTDAEILGVKLPRDEPFETLFTILNAVSLLGMHSIRIGG